MILASKAAVLDVKIIVIAATIVVINARSVISARNHLSTASVPAVRITVRNVINARNRLSIANANLPITDMVRNLRERLIR